MIKKLRKKFVITSLLSIFALLTVILLVINLVNFALVADDADRVLATMIEQGGGFREGFRPGDEEMKGPRGPKGPESPEIGQTTRYFTITFGEDGTVEDVDLHLNAVSPEKAVEWGKSLLDKKGGWTQSYYRYRVWQKDGKTFVTVIDQSRELLPSYRVLIASVVGEAIGLLITFAVLLYVSKAVSDPIERSDRKQKRFIQDATFELKDPILSIDASRLTLEKKLGKSEESEMIAKETEHLTKVVQGLDTLLLLENPQPKDSWTEIDLSSLLNELAAPYYARCEEGGIAFSVEAEEGILYRGDLPRLERLFTVCLKNGAEYSHTAFSVRLSKEDSRVILTFINDAPGIEEGSLDSVFERFWRSPEARKSGIDGAGLGLSVAREIVRYHGGRIRAEGKQGRFLLKIEL